MCKADSKELHKLKLERKNMLIDERGVLMRKCEEKQCQIVLPKFMQNLVYKHLHVDLDHGESSSVGKKQTVLAGNGERHR